MDAQRWLQIEELFQRACDCDRAPRLRLLEECGECDSELRRTVEALLASAEAATQGLEAAVRGGFDALAFPLVGERISHYRILAGIGAGGMGSVYRGEDLRLGRQVALKFLAEEFARDSAALGRFEREARSASALEHPNICTVYEFGEHAGQPFLVMPLLQGETLRELLARRAPAPLGISELLALSLQIAAALEAAHEHGIIHRDIKPANIFITTRGEAKILDFGLAKAVHWESAEDESRDRVTAPANMKEGPIAPVVSPEAFATRTGFAMGTSAYMSPEQARSERLDPRTDIFSFGLVLYEMATGHRAFQGVTEPVLHDLVLRQNPPPARQSNPALPARLEAVIRRSVEKDRDARYLTAAELIADLAAVQQATEGRSARLLRPLPSAAVVALLTCAVVATWWLAERRVTAPPAPNGKLQQLTTNSWENPVGSGSISPDGRYLAYTDASGIHIKHVGAEDSQLVPQPKVLRGQELAWDISSSAWSADSSRFIATSHPATEDPSEWASPTSAIWSVSVSGRAPRKLRDAARAWNVSLNGPLISFGTGKGKRGERELWVMGFDDQLARRVLQVDDTRAICCMYFLRDGTRIAYVAIDESGGTLVARDLTGGPVVTLLPPTALSSIGDIVWLPDGRMIYAEYCELFGAPCNLWIERFDTQSGKLTEKARRVAPVMEASLRVPSATSDGRLVAFLRSTGYGTTYVADMEAGATGIRNVRHFSLVEGDDSIVDWMPDSQSAIITRSRGDHFALYKQALQSQVAQPIVARLDNGVVEDARLSPDAKSVILLVLPITAPPAAVGGLPSRLEVWRAPVNGGALQRLFSLAAGSAYSCARAPVSLCVTGEITADRRQAIVSAFDPTTGRRGKELLRFDRYADADEDPGLANFDLSPDGQWLGTSAGPSGALRILSLRGAPERVIPLRGSNARALRWASDGKGLIVSSYHHDGSVLLHVDLQANVHELLHCESGVTCLGVPSPDGRYLGIYQARTMSNIWMVENF